MHDFFSVTRILEIICNRATGINLYVVYQLILPQDWSGADYLEVNKVKSNYPSNTYRIQCDVERRLATVEGQNEIISTIWCWWTTEPWTFKQPPYSPTPNRRGGERKGASWSWRRLSTAQEYTLYDRADTIHRGFTSYHSPQGIVYSSSDYSVLRIVTWKSLKGKKTFFRMMKGRTKFTKWSHSLYRS